MGKRAMHWRKSNKSELIVAPFEVKAKDDGKRTFEGVLSTSHLDLGDGWTRDIVHPGAFKRWIDSFTQSKNGYVPLLDSHNSRSIFNVYGHLLEVEERLTGKTLVYELEGGQKLEVDEMVLATKWQVIEGEDGERVLNRIRPGSVRKMSMGYEPINYDFGTLKGGDRFRNLREVRVEEGSLVVFPMQPNAEIDLASIKSIVKDDENLTPEEFETLKALYEQIGKVLARYDEQEKRKNEATPETIKALEERLQRLKLHQLATRIEATRHLGLAVVGDS